MTRAEMIAAAESLERKSADLVRLCDDVLEVMRGGVTFAHERPGAKHITRDEKPLVGLSPANTGGK